MTEQDNFLELCTKEFNDAKTKNLEPEYVEQVMNKLFDANPDLYKKYRELIQYTFDELQQIYFGCKFIPSETSKTLFSKLYMSNFDTALTKQRIDTKTNTNLSSTRESFLKLAKTLEQNHNEIKNVSFNLTNEENNVKDAIVGRVKNIIDTGKIQKDTGQIIIHGPPSAGKTTLIKWII